MMLGMICTKKWIKCVNCNYGMAFTSLVRFHLVFSCQLLTQSSHQCTLPQLLCKHCRVHFQTVMSRGMIGLCPMFIQALHVYVLQQYLKDVTYISLHQHVYVFVGLLPDKTNTKLTITPNGTNSPGSTPSHKFKNST